MNLNNIPTIKGATHPRKRLARGEGNGHGKTAGKGHKGQRARSGRGIRVGFEGGQMPLYRKLPRRGFNNKDFRTVFATVNLGELSKIEGDTIGRDELIAAGLIRKSDVRVKLLGDGSIERALTITVDAASASAKAKVEAAGGTVTVPAAAATADEA